MNEETQKFIEGTGALVEAIALFRDESINHGFTRAEAISLCGTYLSCILSLANNINNTKEDNN